MSDSTINSSSDDRPPFAPEYPQASEAIASSGSNAPPHRVGVAKSLKLGEHHAVEFGPHTPMEISPALGARTAPVGRHMNIRA